MQKKKSLGQNFLTNAYYLSVITDTAQIKKGDTVLEIGPGEGALTEVLLRAGAHVVAIEKDHRLIPFLQEKFSGANMQLYEKDALEIEEDELGLSSYKLVANIPYYITGALLKKFLSAKVQPTCAILLVQKEVAERIARSKKESILSLSVKVYGQPKYVKTVPRGAFSPAPTVDSAILLVESISRSNFSSTEHEECFFTLVRTGFSQKRKLLASNLKPVAGEGVTELFAQIGIPANARAEDVPLEQWLSLSEALLST